MIYFSYHPENIDFEKSDAMTLVLTACCLATAAFQLFVDNGIIRVYYDERKIPRARNYAIFRMY